MRRKQYRAIQGSGTCVFKVLASWSASSSSVYSFAMAAREMWKRREWSFTFMSIPQQRKKALRGKATILTMSRSRI